MYGSWCVLCYADDMSANDYDGHADEIQRVLDAGKARLNVYVERPAMYALLPADLSGKKALCIGCGTGDECGEFLKRGAAVWGLDISGESIKLAARAFPKANLAVMDMHSLVYGNNTFDFVYSGLALHYVEHLDVVLAEIQRVLKPGGLIQFSVGHPIKWAAEPKRDADDEAKKSFVMGYDTFTKLPQVYGDYLNVTRVTQKPEHYPVVTYWNRPISAYIHSIQDAGFELLDFIEPKPDAKVRTLDPEYYAIHSKIPQVMIFVAEKRQA